MRIINWKQIGLASMTALIAVAPGCGNPNPGGNESKAECKADADCSAGICQNAKCDNGKCKVEDVFAGTACKDGDRNGFCLNKVCNVKDCYIDGSSLVTGGSASASDACKICDPSVSLTKYSDKVCNANGAGECVDGECIYGCKGDSECSDSICVNHECKPAVVRIGGDPTDPSSGTVVNDGDKNPSNKCEIADSSRSRTGYSPVVCDASDDNECRTNTCNKDTGNCEFVFSFDAGSDGGSDADTDAVCTFNKIEGVCSVKDQGDKQQGDCLVTCDSNSDCGDDICAGYVCGDDGYCRVAQNNDYVVCTIEGSSEVNDGICQSGRCAEPECRVTGEQVIGNCTATQYCDAKTYSCKEGVTEAGECTDDVQCTDVGSKCMQAVNKKICTIQTTCDNTVNKCLKLLDDGTCSAQTGTLDDGTECKFSARSIIPANMTVTKEEGNLLKIESTLSEGNTIPESVTPDIVDGLIQNGTIEIILKNTQSNVTASVGGNSSNPLTKVASPTAAGHYSLTISADRTKATFKVYDRLLNKPMASGTTYQISINVKNNDYLMTETFTVNAHL